MNSYPSWFRMNFLLREFTYNSVATLASGIHHPNPHIVKIAPQATQLSTKLRRLRLSMCYWDYNCNSVYLTYSADCLFREDLMSPRMSCDLHSDRVPPWRLVHIGWRDCLFSEVIVENSTPLILWDCFVHVNGCSVLWLLVWWGVQYSVMSSHK